MKDLVLHPSEFTLKVLSDCVNVAPWPVKLSLSIVSFVANTVARAIASSKQSYYANQVSCLKSSDPNCWWKHIKQLHGKSPSYVNFTISHNGSILSVTRLLDFLNHFFLLLSLMTLLLLTTVHFLLSSLHQNSFLLYSLPMKSSRSWQILKSLKLLVQMVFLIKCWENSLMS